MAESQKLQATRGIEQGQDRFKAGDKLSRSKAESIFGKVTVKHWLKTRTLVVVKGGKDAGKE